MTDSDATSSVFEMNSPYPEPGPLKEESNPEVDFGINIEETRRVAAIQLASTFSNDINELLNNAEKITHWFETGKINQ